MTSTAHEVEFVLSGEHCNVGLVSVTPDAENLILYIARVSSDQSNNSPGLLRFLIRNGHWSPFEHAHMTLEIHTSRAMSAQLIRHRSFAFQEFSQRYSDPTGFVVAHPRRQGETNRQSSTDDLPRDVIERFEREQARLFKQAAHVYDLMVNGYGVARESARFLLPMSARTKVYMTGSLRSWIHYIQLRTEPGTQEEHQEIAELARVIFVEHFPIISDALEWTPGWQDSA
jgi:thymidylate synthase (FAD)